MVAKLSCSLSPQCPSIHSLHPWAGPSPFLSSIPSSVLGKLRHPWLILGTQSKHRYQCFGGKHVVSESILVGFLFLSFLLWSRKGKMWAREPRVWVAPAPLVSWVAWSACHHQVPCEVGREQSPLGEHSGTELGALLSFPLCSPPSWSPS